MLIKNGLIINPASAESYKADLLIEDGFISDIVKISLLQTMRK